MKYEREKELEHLTPASTFKSPDRDRRFVLQQAHSISKPQGEARGKLQFLHPAPDPTPQNRHLCEAH